MAKGGYIVEDGKVMRNGEIVEDGKVMRNGETITYYEFDRDSNSFWINTGAKQTSFEEKDDIIDYFKKREFAKGGFFGSGRARDMKRLSQEEHEQRYLPNRKRPYLERGGSLKKDGVKPHAEKILVKSGDEIVVVFVKDKISDNEYVVSPDEAHLLLQRRFFNDDKFGQFVGKETAQDDDPEWLYFESDYKNSDFWSEVEDTLKEHEILTLSLNPLATVTELTPAYEKKFYNETWKALSENGKIKDKWGKVFDRNDFNEAMQDRPLPFQGYEFSPSFKLKKIDGYMKIALYIPSVAPRKSGWISIQELNRIAKSFQNDSYAKGGSTYQGGFVLFADIKDEGTADVEFFANKKEAEKRKKEYESGKLKEVDTALGMIPVEEIEGFYVEKIR